MGVLRHPLVLASSREGRGVAGALREVSRRSHSLCELPSAGRGRWPVRKSSCARREHAGPDARPQALSPGQRVPVQVELSFLSQLLDGGPGASSWEGGMRG